MNRRGFLSAMIAAPMVGFADKGEGMAAGIVALGRRASRPVGAWLERTASPLDVWCSAFDFQPMTKADIDGACMFAAKTRDMMSAAYNAALSVQVMAEAEGELDAAFLTLGKKMSMAPMEYLNEYLQDKANNTGDREADDES